MGFIAFFKLGEENYTYVSADDVSACEEAPGRDGVTLFLKSTTSRYVVDAISADQVVLDVVSARRTGGVVRIRHLRAVS